MPLTDADTSKAHAVACDAIQDRVRQAIGRKCFVFFSAYALDNDNLPVDNLDDVPLTGKIVVRAGRVPGVSSSLGYQSPVMVSPTWLDLCIVANEQIVKTRDRSRCYLEQVDAIEAVGDIQFVALRLGS
jgi:hypothetical protein